MEGRCQGVEDASRSRAQESATVITLIFAGRLRRCRMTVIRHRSFLRLGARGETAIQTGGHIGDCARPGYDQRPQLGAHAAAGVSCCNWPMAQTKPANSRAIAVTV